MEVISSVEGLRIKFESKDEMRSFINALEDQLQWIEEENVEPPYVHGQFPNEGVPEERMRELVDKGEESDEKYNPFDDPKAVYEMWFGQPG